MSDVPPTESNPSATPDPQHSNYPQQPQPQVPPPAQPMYPPSMPPPPAYPPIMSPPSGYPPSMPQPGQYQPPYPSAPFTGYPNASAPYPPPVGATGPYPTGAPFNPAGYPPQMPPPTGPGFAAPFAPIPPPQKGWRALKKWQWVLISISSLLLLCCMCGIVSSAFSNHNSANSTDSNQNGNAVGRTPSSTNTFGPTAIPTNTPLPSPTPTYTPGWITVTTIKGNQPEKSPQFMTNNLWRIEWSCNPSSGFLDSYIITAYVDIVHPDGTRDLIDWGISETCDSSNTSGTSDHHFDSGSYVLDINTYGQYTFAIQEFR